MGDAKMMGHDDGALTDPFDTVHMGVTGENVAAKCSFTRAVQDEFAVESTAARTRPLRPGSSRTRSCRSRSRARRGVTMYDVDEHVRSDASLGTWAS
jgi:acetyl-CoA C-acetyltransferase